LSTSYLNLMVDGLLVTEVTLNHVSVTQELNHHWWCHAQCRHLEDQRIPEIVQGLVGQPSIIRVENWLGKDFQVLAIENGSQKVIFDGFILEIELEYELSSAYTAVIQGVTRSYKMDVTPRHAYYPEKTLKDVAQQLAGNASLSASVNCADRPALNYVQWGETDFQFLHRLVDDHGAWMRPTEDGIEIYDSFQNGTTVKWQKASEKDALLTFSLRCALAPAAFNGAHYHFHQMKSQTYQDVSEEPEFFDSASHLVEAAKKACNDVMPSGYLHQRSRAVTLDDYEKLLKKESARSLGSTVVGSGQTQNREVLPGNKVKIQGTLDADGEYGVTQVSHSWDPTGYSNQISCTPWKNYTDPHPPEVRPWYGLVPARVVEHNDPKKMGRIKVQYFWQEDNKAYWARMVTPHAGADRGFMFMPEEGDEVVVGFEDGDIERPVVLGSVWNGVDQAPREEFWGGELKDNDVKRIVTKSGHRMQFVDKKGKESIVIATPKHLKVSLIETTDETGRSMLTLHSENGDIFLSAPNGRIHFHSKFFSREVG
jgi:type VI secretion system secreted protein VgrG